jgi:hypothetical protein
LLQRTPGRDGFNGAAVWLPGEGNLRRAGFAPGHAVSRKSGSFLDDQLGVLYGSQQEPDSKQLEFYGHPLIPAFRSEPQRSPRTLQHYI